MNKIFRTKSASGGLSVRLDHITAIRYTAIEGNTDLAVEIVTQAGILDAPMTAEQLEALQKVWNELL